MKPCIAIIGTREPDPFQQMVAFRVAQEITAAGGEVNTGAADGIDTDAMNGSIPDHLNVFLPWSSYNRNKIPQGARITVYNPKIHVDWTTSVKKYHPAFSRLTRGPLALHARNFGIVKGTVGVFALPNEKGGGGTGQGIKIAKSLGIPLFQYDKNCPDPTPIQAIIDSALGLLKAQLATVQL